MMSRRVVLITPTVELSGDGVAALFQEPMVLYCDDQIAAVLMEDANVAKRQFKVEARQSVIADPEHVTPPCKRRDHDEGYWTRFPSYVRERTDHPCRRRQYCGNERS